MTDPSLPTGESKAATVRSLFDRIGPRYDLVNRVMTFGMDVGWRRRAIRELHLPPGARVFDLACGTGDLCRELQRAGHRPIGFDFAFGMLANARTAAPLVQADALRLPVRDASADGVTCGFALRNVVSLDGLFTELARVVRPGGTVASLEFGLPRGLWRPLWETHVRLVLPAAGWAISPGWHRVGDFLGDSIRDLYRRLPEERLLELWDAAGIADVRTRRLSLGGGLVVWGARR